ncbi:hypothetical protein CO151_00045 [bacterium CG_4_9_14_3_um_filter_65_15]|nr:MAG: hypothetical protein CO151_00045 [bacterium CG_4_9_14_3_um_filter_65_15]
MSMRVTDSYLSSLLVGDLNRSLSSLLQSQRTAGSMRRVNSYADDPRSVSKIQRYNQLISMNEQYRNNVSRSRVMADTTDTALQTIMEVLGDVRVIALRESSALATGQTMGTATVEVDNEVNRLLDVLNSSVEGSYIFGGMETSQPPFVRSNGTVIYQGDGRVMMSRTGPNSLVPVNIPGNTFLGTQSSVLGGRQDLSPIIKGTTNLDDLDLGGGWEPGAISLSDGLGNIWEIDLSSALTVDDVLNTINTATGGAVTASLTADGTGFEFIGTGPLAVTDMGDTNTATSLGINVTSDGGILTGRDIRAQALSTTLLADIDSMAGKLPLGSMQVDYQGSSYTVDLSTATTLGDIETLFEAAVPGIELQIGDSTLQVVGGTPDVFKISNADGTNTASLLGIEGSGTPVRLFGMLDDLKSALDMGDKDGVRSILSELESLQNLVSRQLILNGGRQNDLDWADEVLLERDERLRNNLSLEYDADAAQVAADLSRAQMSYQASLTVTSQMFQYNLIQFLR